MIKIYRYMLLCVVLVSFVACPNTVVFAANEKIFMHQDTVIPEKQSVSNVIVIGGDATIAGEVQDVVLVFNGDLDIKRTASITGEVIVIGGRIKQEPGAVLTDNVVNFSFDTATKNSLFIGGLAVLAVWFLRIAFSLLLFILPLLAAYILKARIQPFRSLLHQRPLHVLLIGFAASLFALAAGVLLSITVIGLPIAILLAMAILLSCIIGLAAITMQIGEWVPIQVAKPLWLQVMMGAVAMIAGVNLPLIGGLLLLCLLWLSLGITVVWVWEKRK